MVDVDMSSTPLKFIRREAYLQIKGPYRLSKDPRLKRGPNTLWREELKEIKDFMKVCMVKYTMGVARNNELEFERPPKHHPF
jgi:hypothetical protein